jgi:hypothetical protein
MTIEKTNIIETDYDRLTQEILYRYWGVLLKECSEAEKEFGTISSYQAEELHGFSMAVDIHSISNSLQEILEEFEGKR